MNTEEMNREEMQEPSIVLPSLGLVLVIGWTVMILIFSSWMETRDTDQFKQKCRMNGGVPVHSTEEWSCSTQQNYIDINRGENK